MRHRNFEVDLHLQKKIGGNKKTEMSSNKQQILAFFDHDSCYYPECAALTLEIFKSTSSLSSQDLDC